MPKDKNNGREMTPDEKFRSFFSTTAVDIPEEMTRRDENQPEEKPQKRFGLFGRGKEKQETDEAAAEQPQEMPTGEVRLGEDAQPEPEADLELMLKPEADPEQELAPWPFLEKEAEDTQPEAPAKKPEEKSAPQTAEPPAAVKPETPRQSAVPAARPAEQHSTAKPLRHPKNAPEVLLPQEEQEQQEMAQLKAMINGLSDQKPEKPAPRAEAAPAAETEPDESKKKPSGAPLPAAVFAAVKETAPELQPEPVPQPEKQPVADFFGKAQSEDAPQAPLAPAEEPAAKEDTMSLPLLPLDGEEPQQAPEKAPAAPQPELKAEAEDAVSPEEHAETELTEPEVTADKLHRMSAELTLRCVLGGILAVVLLHFGLVSDGLLPAMAALDPDAAPAAFYGANLLLLAASLCVGFPVLRDGLNGLRGRSSSETMPALAAVAALVQAVTAMLNANVYRGTTGISLLSGMAALGLFLALLGSRVMLAAVKGGYELVTNGVEFEGAYRAKDKDLLRALARDLEQKDPWVLLSRPMMKEADGFVEQSLSERASERRARKVSYILLGVALLSGVLFLLAGAGWNKAAAAMAAVLCMGAPLSSTLIAGVASLRLQRAAAAVGAVVPGWQAIEQLGGIDTLQIDADDLFTADSAQLEDIRIFKGGRIDRAILYAASVLNQSGGTLQGLFRQIIEDRTDILFPVKDLEIHRGLGFAAWCDNNHIQIGTRRFLEQEGVALPDEDYENQHSKNGELQILYLAVSGNVHAMFVIRYVGGRNIARSLAALQQENIRLLVTSLDPSLTAKHITEAYRLPEGMVTLLDQEQCAALEAATAEDAPCCMYHQKGFASLTGGLRAADKAQNAETTATTVQMVSVLFSVAIAVLLTSARSIWQLPVTYVLMYQAAWSALSIAVCALKQHN